MRYVAVIFFFVSTVTVKAQENLVPNPSFEDYTICPTNGYMEYAVPWYSPYSHAHYLNACSSGNYNVPNGVAGGGGEEAYDGQAYSLISVYVSATGFENARQFVETELDTFLIAGKKYQVEFHVSLLDSAWYATSSMGACFTANGIGNNLTNIFALTPQIQNSDSVFLYEKDKWMTVNGSFYADGTEKYIAIGNFRNDQNTDTIFIYQGPPNVRQAIYYLDYVSVTLDTTTSITEVEKQNLKVFPNPAITEITVSGYSPAYLKLCDAVGQTVAESSSNNLYVGNLSQGLYVLQLFDAKGQQVKTEKVIVAK